MKLLLKHLFGLSLEKTSEVASKQRPQDAPDHPVDGPQALDVDHDAVDVVDFKVWN